MEYFIVYLLGAALYGLAELLWRGWTHWTMLLCGGLCFTLIYIISGSGLGRVRKWILCAAVITAVEFETGLLVNLTLGWGVWDYSDMPLNLMGQICPAFTLAWLALSVPGTALCTLLRRRFGYRSLDQ